MQLVTGEFVLISLLLFLFTRLKTHLLKSERLLRGLRVFQPPSDSELKTYDKEPHKFAISYLTLEDKASVKSHFFTETDFLVLMAQVAMTLCLVSSVLHRFLDFEQTLSFYMCLLTLSLCISGLYQQFLRAKLLSPDNGIALVFTLLIFSLSSVCVLSDFSHIFDFNFPISMRVFELQMTIALRHAWENAGFSCNYTAFVCAISAAFALVLLPIFNYLLRGTLTYFAGGLDVTESKKTSLLVLISPVLCIPLWLKPMTKDLLVPVYLSDLQFQYIRLGIVLGVSFIRIYQMRTQIQHFLNQSVSIAYSMFAYKEKEEQHHCRLQIAAINGSAWARLHQHLCVVLLGVFICMVLLKKGCVPEASLAPVVNVGVEELDEEEFAGTPAMMSAVRTQHSSTPRYLEILELEQKLASLDQDFSDSGFISRIVEINKIGFVPPLLYHDMLNFMLLWYHVHWALATAFAVLYSRRFGSLKIKQV